MPSLLFCVNRPDSPTHITHWLLLKIWLGLLGLHITPFSTVCEISRLRGPWAGQQCAKGPEATWLGGPSERLQGVQDPTWEGRHEVPERRMQKTNVATLPKTSVSHNPWNGELFLGSSVSGPVKWNPTKSFSLTCPLWPSQPWTIIVAPKWHGSTAAELGRDLLTLSEESWAYGPLRWQ